MWRQQPSISANAMIIKSVSVVSIMEVVKLVPRVGWFWYELSTSSNPTSSYKVLFPCPHNKSVYDIASNTFLWARHGLVLEYTKKTLPCSWIDKKDATLSWGHTFLWAGHCLVLEHTKKTLPCSWIHKKDATLSWGHVREDARKHILL